MERAKVAFVTHFCPHYRVKTFERLAQLYDVDYLFYSPGNEWYGQGIHGVRGGDFRYKYLSGIQLGRRLRITPSLVTYLWREHYVAVVKCINGRFALPATYVIARLRRVPFVLWMGTWMTVRTPFQLLVFPLARWLFRHADAIAVYGEHTKTYLVQHGVAAEKIFVAAHAVDNSLYCAPVSAGEQARCKAELSLDERKVVLYLGRLEEIKGLDYLLHAFAHMRHENAMLVLAGDGSLRESLTMLARDLGILENTRFAGYVRPEDALRYYSIAHVFVLPSITTKTQKETWGLVINEAMNQGLPVVATEAVGAAAGGLVQSGINGFVVPERNTYALAESIGRILEDDELQREMSGNARRIIGGWDNERMVSGFQQAIEYAVSARRPKAAAVAACSRWPQTP
jgi:glycosyltransferase involved in cell wall biosynthesis